MTNVDRLRERLGQALKRPALTLTPLAVGMDTTVYAIDADLVAKVGHHADAASSLAMQAALQRYLAPLLAPALIPTPVVQLDGDAETGPVLVEQRLAGNPIGSLDPSQRATALAQLVELCRRLHQVPVSSVIGLGLPLPETPWADRFDRQMRHALTRLAPQLHPRTLRFLEKRLTALAHELQTANPTSTLVHGDLTHENIIILDNFDFIGLFDFGDMAVADPAYDLRTFRTLGTDRDYPQTIARYDPSTGFARRVALYEALLPLEQALWALEIGGSEAAAHACQRLDQIAVGAA